MTDNYYYSPNNIRLGNDEIDLIMNYLNINKKELEDRLKNNSISFYFHINTVSYKLIVNEPPHIYYEIYLLFKINEKYYRQIFSKKKFPLEFKYLNEFEYYCPLTPFDQSIHFKIIEYPLYNICFMNNIYSKEEEEEILKILIKRIPYDVSNIILKFLVVKTYDKSKNSFYVTNSLINNNNLVIDKFLPVSNAKVIISLKV